MINLLNIFYFFSSPSFIKHFQFFRGTIIILIFLIKILIFLLLKHEEIVLKYLTKSLLYMTNLSFF